jgi:hypothetical protein
MKRAKDIWMFVMCIMPEKKPLKHLHINPGLTLECDLGKEVALWLLTSLCTSAKREVEVAL